MNYIGKTFVYNHGHTHIIMEAVSINEDKEITLVCRESLGENRISTGTSCEFSGSFFKKNCFELVDDNEAIKFLEGATI